MNFLMFMYLDSILLLLYLDYTSILFVLGFSSLLINRRNFLIMLLSLEITFLASALNFIFFSSFFSLFTGVLYGIFILLIVIIDTVFGFSLIICSYRSSKFSTLNTLCASYENIFKIIIIT